MTPVAAVERLWSTGELDSVFRDADRTVVPWPSAPRRRGHPTVTPAVAKALLSGAPALADIDPRQLHATQTWVVRHHAAYYRSGRWERTGATSADPWSLQNRYPLLHVDEHGCLVLLGGHHRALVALVEGRPLRGRVLRQRPAEAVPLLPSLFVGHTATVPVIPAGDGAQAARLITAGRSALVPTTLTAHDTLRRLGLTDEVIADRFRVARLRQPYLASPDPQEQHR